MGPIRNTADNLDTARAVRGTTEVLRSLFFLRVVLFVATVESLLEAVTHVLPLLTVRVTSDGLLRGDFNVVREGEPIVSAEDIKSDRIRIMHE